MKPIIMFVLGVAFASVIAIFVVNRKPVPETPTPVATVVPEPETPAPPALPAAEPEPVKKQSPSVSVRPKHEARRTSPTFSSSSSAPSPTPASPTASSAPQSTTTTTAQVGGPPQTTISMPPAPGPDSSAPITPSKPVAPAREPKTVTIPAGTMLAVRVDDHLSTSTAHTGDSFRATLEQPLVVDGFVLAERGSRVEGRVAESDPGGKVQGLAKLNIELVRLNTSDGQRIRLQTDGYNKLAEKNTKKDAAKIGIGAGLGAAIGAIAGGGKGAAIGAGVGGAAGTGAVMATRGNAAEIPAESQMTFRIRDAITVTEKLK